MGAISQQLGVAMQSMDTMAVRPRPSPAAHASTPSLTARVRVGGAQIAQNMDLFGAPPPALPGRTRAQAG